jgi:SAM-dependent methyltransferase
MTATPAAAAAPPVHLRCADGSVVPLPVKRWLDEAGPAELALLRRALPPVLDVGCGPGRLVLAAAHLGWPALGLEVAPTAVRLGRSRGANILERSVFHPIPGAGRWGSALLIDGTIGIDGSPVRLLRRLKTLLGSKGLVLAEVEEPGFATRSFAARIETPLESGSWFRWARVGVDAVGGLARQAGLAVDETWQEGNRWFAALSEP